MRTILVPNDLRLGENGRTPIEEVANKVNCSFEIFGVNARKFGEKVRRAIKN